jgi:hypothetical protein
MKFWIPKFERFAWLSPAVKSSREEQQPLLADHEEEEQHADQNGLYPPNKCWTSDNSEPHNRHDHLPVYETIHQYADALLQAHSSLLMR